LADNTVLSEAGSILRPSVVLATVLLMIVGLTFAPTSMPTPVGVSPP
jgi:hypothetical protein